MKRTRNSPNPHRSATSALGPDRSLCGHRKDSGKYRRQAAGLPAEWCTTTRIRQFRIAPPTASLVLTGIVQVVAVLPRNRGERRWPMCAEEAIPGVALIVRRDVLRDSGRVFRWLPRTLKQSREHVLSLSKSAVCRAVVKRGRSTIRLNRHDFHAPEHERDRRGSLSRVPQPAHPGVALRPLCVYAMRRAPYHRDE